MVWMTRHRHGRGGGEYWLEPLGWRQGADCQWLGQ
jgi:hypothetical protein